jgi:hypothetical protein
MATKLCENEIHQEIIGKLMDKEDCLSYSSLCAFIDSPKTFIDYKLGKKEQTDAMLYGAMLHCLILEPHDFFNRYFCIDDTDKCEEIGGAKPRATKAYKEWHSGMTANAGKKTIIKPGEYEHAKIVAENVLHNRASRKVLSMAKNHEQKVEWEYINFKFKGFIDGEDEVIIDIKSMADACKKKAQREIVDNKHYLQAAMYLTARGVDKDYYIIAVDKKGGVSVHLLNKQLIAQGKQEYKFYVNKFNECILDDAWNQSYDFYADRWDGIYTAEKPGWMY